MIYWIIAGFLIAGVIAFCSLKGEYITIGDKLSLSLIMGLVGSMASLFLCLMCSLIMLGEPETTKIPLENYELVPVIEVHPDRTDIFNENIYAIEDDDQYIVYIREENGIISKKKLYCPKIQYDITTQCGTYEVVKECYKNEILRKLLLFNTTEETHLVLPSSSAIYSNPLSNL